MKIFDCFTFHNEFDLLELRLKEHWEYVDYFVIAEGNLTHQGARDKPFYLADNFERFKDFQEKIIHIQVSDMPRDSIDPWVREIFQRNALSRGLSLANPEDIISVSDCDEILRPSTWQEISNDQSYNIWGSKSHTFNFKINYVLTNQRLKHFYFIFNMAARAKEKLSPQQIRDLRTFIHTRKDSKIIGQGGWHFSFLGDTNFVSEKIKNWAHHEFSYIADIVDVEKSIELNRGIDPKKFETFEAVLLDNYFPSTILKNRDRWKDHIIERKILPSIVNLF